MKWVAQASAVLALGFAILQLVRTVGDARDRRRQVEELVKTEATARRSGDYERAWTDLDEALKVAESGGLVAKLTGQLSKEAQDLRVAQENLAMAWLDNIRVGANQTFSSVVDRLTPVMTRGAAMAGGARKADLMAHIGYGASLEARDGRSAGDPAQSYRDAIAIDPANPYAHAYLGHDLLGHGVPLDEGKAEFQKALASGRAKDYVRVLQLAAMKNRGSEGDAEYIAAINDMRKNGELVDESMRGDLYSIYWPACGSLHEDADALKRFAALTPPAEQAATVKVFLIDQPNITSSQRPAREACFATLLQAAGDRAGALAVWESVRKEAQRVGMADMRKRAEDATRRLK
jgi:tetratricopeptide (TPR) repeat protein